ncbi:MAG: hypothetical protein ACOCUF_03000 [Patescibacteria group bacterium]
MRKNKEIPIWLKAETYLAVFFLIALTASYFKAADLEKFSLRGDLRQEYIILSSAIATIWVVSVLFYLIAIRKK